MICKTSTLSIYGAMVINDSGLTESYGGPVFENKCKNLDIKDKYKTLADVSSLISALSVASEKTSYEGVPASSILKWKDREPIIREIRKETEITLREMLNLREEQGIYIGKTNGKGKLVCVVYSVPELTVGAAGAFGEMFYKELEKRSAENFEELIKSFLRKYPK